MDLSPEALAAQAQELVQATIMSVAIRSGPYDKTEVLRRLSDAIVAALGAVRDAVRAETAKSREYWFAAHQCAEMCAMHAACPEAWCRQWSEP